MARILIADDQPGSSRLRDLLRGHDHDLEIATKFADAVALSGNAGFDLIIIGVHFDESQMYELISAIKRNPKLKSTPVMGFSETHTNMSRANRASCESGTYILGACDYVDTEGMSNEEILERIHACIAESKGVGRKINKTDETPTQKRQQQQQRRANQAQ